MERTLVLVKPDAVIRGLIGEVVSRFEKKGLKIIGMKMMSLDEKTLDEHYSHLRDKPFFQGIKEFMMSAPVVAMVLEGEGAVDEVRRIAGATRPWEAEPGTLRGDFALGLPANIIHASDSPETAEEEIRRFFKPEEIFQWSRPFDELFERR